MLFEPAPDRRRRPTDIAITDFTCSRSWEELENRATRIAHLLRDEMGVGPNEHVALLMENRVEVIELLLGAMLAGVWMTPINWHLTEDEIAYVIRDSGARTVFSDERYADLAQSAGAPSRVRVGAELDRALESVSDSPFDPDGPPGGPMIYTSGTTGKPKGVKRTRPPTLAGMLARGRRSGLGSGLDGAGPHLITGPMYHAAPLMFAVYDQMNGAPIEIMRQWNAEKALDLIAQREIVHTHLVPTMFVRILRLPEAVRSRFSAPRLELVLHGAAPISPDIKRQMIHWWGPIFVEYWGGTEGGVNTLADSAQWLAHPGTVGKVLPAFDVFAVDDEGRRLPPGSAGSLYCRNRQGGSVFAYHRAEEKTAEAHLPDGSFTLGDIGRVDEDGFVYLVDRRSHTIISGGVNIYPAEIEQVLQGHPAVADVAVFGVPDEEWGESVKAAIELSAGFEASQALCDEILSFGREHLASYKVPRSIDFEDALPRHPSGKLVTRKLRDPYWKGRERKI